jgi:predicted aldo/keto reductase-like oxidoreductase
MLRAADKAAKRTAADQVTLGKTGIKLSRLGIGTGSNSGEVQRSLGREGFNKLLRYAYDQGITYIDTAQNYHTHDWIRDAIKGLPREKLFIQTKMPDAPDKPLEVLDRYRKELGVDYLDSVLSHFAHTPDWPETRKRVLDALDEAKEKQIIRAKGVSCHGMPALLRATALDWVDVHLVRINPQGRHMDGAGAFDHEVATEGPMKQIAAMRAKGRGMIGMKIIGNGEFTEPEDREKSIRYAMHCGMLDAVVIGFASTSQIDEAIERINRALAEA